MLGHGRCTTLAYRAIAILSVACVTGTTMAQSPNDWPNVFNDKGRMRFSALDQINPGNVGKLTVAWRYKTGDSRTGSTIECTPLIIDGVMYVTTVTTKVVALDAAT